jgi:hypothetical protein
MSWVTFLNPARWARTNGRPRHLSVAARKQKRRCFSPGLELLEDRNLPSFVGFANPLYYGVNVYQSNGAGSVVADLNGDGKLDLALANNAANSISVLLGNGDGTFQSPANYLTGSSFSSTALAVGDFNGDGIPDLAAVTYDSNVSVLIGNGNGTFQAPKRTAIPVGYIPTQLIATDLEGDGKQDDLVVTTATSFTQSVVVFQGNGDGTFHTTQIFSQTNYSAFPGIAVAADFNGDNKPDLAISNPLLSTVSVELGKGDGTFQNGQTVSIGRQALLAMVAGDFAGNGKTSLIVSDYGTDSLLRQYSDLDVLTGNGDGTFQLPQFYSQKYPSFSMAAADFDGNGKLDLVTNDIFGLNVFLGASNGDFQNPQYSIQTSRFFSLATGDFNGDARPDVVATIYSVAGVYMNQLPLSASAVNIDATAGAPFNGPVATFTNPFPSLSSGSYTATIDWGDGNVSTGTVTGNGTLTVSGSNTYANAGSNAVTVSISSTSIALPAAAIVYPTATVTSLDQNVQKGLEGGTGLWHNKNGQALIDSFNGGPDSTALSYWLGTNFSNLWGANGNDLRGETNAQIAAYYQTLFALPGSLDAQVFATALNIYATTQSLGGSIGQAYGFTVTSDGLGAYSFNVGVDGTAVGVANNTTLNVYAILQGVNNLSCGLLYCGDTTLRNEATDLFSALIQAGSIR